MYLAFICLYLEGFETPWPDHFGCVRIPDLNKHARYISPRLFSCSFDFMPLPSVFLTEFHAEEDNTEVYISDVG
jgi:hypothetical protein